MKKKITRRAVSIERAYRILTIFTLVVLTLLLASIVTLFSIFFNTKSMDIIIAVYVISLFFIVGIGLAIYFVIKQSRNAIYLGMFNITKENYERMAKLNTSLISYDETIFTSFKDLNERLNQIQNVYNQSIIFNSRINYEDLPFDFLTSSKNLITYESFAKNYQQLFLRSLVFRNAVISFNFRINDDVLTTDEEQQFIECVTKIFVNNKLLFIDHFSNNQVLVFVPKIDSIDSLKEKITECINQTTFTRYGENGYSLFSARASVVIYPYSDIDHILTDLEYASRQNEQINIYLPNRNNIKNENLIHMNMNLNFIYSILEKFSKIDLNNFESKTSQNAFDKIIHELSLTYHLDYTYMFAYKSDTQSVVPFIFYEDGKRSENIYIKSLPEGMLETICKHMDEDHSYFFSSRDNVSPEIGKFLDIYNINSGYFYVVVENNKPLGLIMFCKRGNMDIDSYLREALYIFSRTISNIVFFISTNASKRLTEYRLNNVLKIANYKAYSVDKRNYKLLSISETLKDTIPTAKLGQYCYQALYGRNNPCQKCPLKTGHKMYGDLQNIHYESSLALSIPRMNEKAILLSPVKNDEFEVRERYDRDLLVYSFFSLLEKMSIEFAMSNHGYLLLVNIDNHDELLRAMNPETYNEYLRSFFKDITETIPEIKDVYFLPSHSFGFIFPNGHRRDIFTIVEKIYTLAKQPYHIGDKAYELNLTYINHSYPFGYQNSTEYIRYIISLWDQYKDKLNGDRLILPETKYIRNSSHKQFVQDVLDSSLSMSTFNIKLQPIVNKQTRHIESAEMLFRVPETYLGNEMNTYEIISAAAENKKIALITQILIDHLGELYKTYGEKLFDRFNIKHLSLNTDFSFFEDLKFIDKMKELENRFNLPEGFMRFEIREDEINKYSEEFIPITKELAKNKIDIVCDNYTGKSVSLTDIKRLGFSGVKIDRSVIENIGTGVDAIDGLVSYVNEAKQLGLDLTFVGVETKEQYSMLKNINSPFYVQGYYYYRPIDAEELINHLLRQNS